MTEIEKMYEKNKDEADLAKYGRIRSKQEREQSEEQEVKTRQEFERIVAEEEEKQRKIKLEKAWRDTVPLKYKDASFENFKIDGPYKDNQKEVVDYMKTMGPLVLIGPNGGGKTHLGYAGCLKAIRLGLTAKHIEEIDFFDEIRISFSRNGPLGVVEKYGKYGYLVIDEVDKTQGSRTEFVYLSRLVNYRDARELTTIILTNATRKGCESLLGESVIDRVAGEGRLLELKADESFRLKRRRENEKKQSQKA
jgi:DNA replication protein DnaC